MGKASVKRTRAPKAVAPLKVVVPNARADVATAQTQLSAAKRILKARKAKDSLIAFTEFTMPGIVDPNDVDSSRYDAKYFHKALAAALEEVEAGRILRLIVTFPPRHGKSELTSRRFPAWLVGRDPYRHVMFATYNQPFSEDYGRAVRGIIQSNQYKTVFPGTTLAKGSAAADRLVTEEGGMMAFVGRGGSSTGRGADFLIIDDPLKDRAEANSQATREELWDWYNDTMSTRLMSDTGAIVIIQCMTGDTPVLMATGAEKPLRDIRIGDEIATYESGEITTSTVRNWANQGLDRIFTIRMKSGITVRANARHPFLVCENGETKWQRTDMLKKGDIILRAIGASGPIPPVQKMVATNPPSAKGGACRTTTSTVGRAGFAHLRSILARAVTHIYGTATVLISRTTSASLLNRVVFAQSASSLPEKMCGHIGAGSSVSITATIAKRCADFFATTATLLLAMGKPRESCGRPLTTFGITHDAVEDVFESGAEDVFDIQVDRTENFIANGLVSHNTRWHEDDLVGRLTDPTNPKYNAEEAATWKIIDIPAIAGEDDVLGRKPGAALWPEKFGLDYLESFRRRNPVGFSALYQQQPTPADGDFFKTEMLNGYRQTDLPKLENLRIYAASDHAVGIKQDNDYTCLLIIGVDEFSNIWLLDCWWQKQKTDKVVEAMIDLMRRWKPLIWWAESGHISKSIGPFLFKRMREEKVYGTMIREQVPAQDKVTRAQSIAGRASMGMVRFPTHLPWCERARSECLKFPQGRHDDFVDTLAHIGLGLDKIIRAPLSSVPTNKPKVGTMGWIKAAGKQAREQAKQLVTLGGM